MTNRLVYLILLTALLGGCGVQVVNESQSGRFFVDWEDGCRNLPLLSARQKPSPNVFVDNPPLRQSVWTYLGERIMTLVELLTLAMPFPRD